ncbi:16S rRNA pseudouridine(516) synthase, partial [uncultured Limnobacter sp.]|uniref:16S rRNA pseudouridine(516) synthase n=1 Tax=uncultured Limnobacter sp. TaxID=199681 RepID=UPI0030FCA45C
QQRNEIMHINPKPVKHFWQINSKNLYMKVRPSVKILQSQGLGSRRECENIFWNSEIFRNETRLDPEIDEISLGDTLLIDGNTFEITQYKYLLMHKPAGYETSHLPSHNPSVFDLLPKHYIKRGLQAAGRLDVDTTGLLLFSDDGQFIHRLISGKVGTKQEIEKIYEVAGARPFTELQLQRLLEGVDLDDEPEIIYASRASLMTDGRLELGITTGKYHQVKRMVAAVGNHVERLHRRAVGPYELPADLPPGSYIEIDPSPVLNRGSAKAA